jgi:hypothetical protein
MTEEEELEVDKVFLEGELEGVPGRFGGRGGEEEKEEGSGGEVKEKEGEEQTQSSLTHTSTPSANFL